MIETQTPNPNRIRINNARLPGVFGITEYVGIGIGIQSVTRVENEAGDHLGNIVYVARKVANGTEYGHRPAGTRLGLTDTVGAVLRLPAVAAMFSESPR